MTKRFVFVAVLCYALTTAAAGCAAVRATFSMPDRDFEVGLWVQAEGSNRTLDSTDKIMALVRRARESGVTDIYAQVYRSGHAWFPTKYADDSPSKRAGRDPLAYLIKLAAGNSSGKRAIRVHAWLNAFSLARNDKAPILADLGKEAVLRDQWGHSLLEYPRSGKPPWARGFGLGTPGIFLDPAHLGVRRRLVIIISELLRRYSGLDGIHLDFIRYPYALPISPGSRFSPRLDFGYGSSSVARFEKETGRKAPLAGVSVLSADYEAWDNWRREQVTATVREARQAIGATRPAVLLSAALLPWAERAYLSAFQDWRGWLSEGLLEKALVMNYSRDIKLASQISRSVSGIRRDPSDTYKKLIIIGLGAWMFSEEPAGLWRQWRDARQAGADGVALFSYDQMVGNDSLWGFPTP